MEENSHIRAFLQNARSKALPDTDWRGTACIVPMFGMQGKRTASGRCACSETDGDELVKTQDLATCQGPHSQIENGRARSNYAFTLHVISQHSPSNTAIAERLVLSPKTVRNYVRLLRPAIKDAFHARFRVAKGLQRIVTSGIPPLHLPV